MVSATSSTASQASALRADIVGATQLDRNTDPARRAWALAEMRRTALLDALSGIRVVLSFTLHSWIGSVDVPTAVIVTRDDRVVPARRQLKLAHPVPGSDLIEIDGGQDAFLTRFGSFHGRAAGRGRRGVLRFAEHGDPRPALPKPATVVPALLRLIEGDLPQGRFHKRRRGTQRTASVRGRRAARWWRAGRARSDPLPDARLRAALGPGRSARRRRWWLWWS